MGWAKLPKQKETQFDGILGDLDNKLWAGHNYITPGEDTINAAHEMTHGVNSVIRNMLVSKSVKRPAGFYFLWNQSFETIQPNCTLTDLANKIPKTQRGPRYDLYLVKQARYWNDSPLYVFDEVCCYINGTRQGLRADENERSIRHSLECGCEMLYYSKICVKHWGTEETQRLYDYCLFILQELAAKIESDNKYVKMLKRQKSSYQGEHTDG